MSDYVDAAMHYSNDSDISYHSHSSSCESTPPHYYVSPSTTPTPSCAEQKRGFSCRIRYKTQMCRYYTNGFNRCPFGQQCSFAHGDEDLRRVDDNINEAISVLPPREMYHELWVQNVKYTRKTGPSGSPVIGIKPPVAPPLPSFATVKKITPTTSWRNDPYSSSIVETPYGGH